MTLRLTLKCSEGCKHCLVNALPTENHVSEETLNNVLNLLKYVNVPLLNISGGEPTENPDYCKIIKYIISFIKENKLKTQLLLQSNGTFIFNNELTNNIFNLLNNPVIYRMYISTNPEFYKDYNKVFNYFKNNHHKKIQLFLDNRINKLKNLGRAKKLNVNLNTVTSCRLAYNIIQQKNFNNLKEFFNLFPNGECAPMININGNIYLGWGIECVCVGNVNKDSFDTIYQNIINYNPCKKCGQII